MKSHFLFSVIERQLVQQSYKNASKTTAYGHAKMDHKEVRKEKRKEGVGRVGD